MNNDSIGQLEKVLDECIENKLYEEATKGLEMLSDLNANKLMRYKNKIANECGPSVLVICIECDNTDIDKFIENQTYNNIEVLEIQQSENLVADILECIEYTQSKYICFIEKNQSYPKDSILNRVKYLEENSDLDVVLAKRDVIDGDAQVMSHLDVRFNHDNFNHDFDGKVFLEYCVNEKTNLYGNLSSILIKTAYAKSIQWTDYHPSVAQIQALSVLYQLIYNTKIQLIDCEVVSSIITKNDSMSADVLGKAYYNFILEFFQHDSTENSDIRLACEKHKPVVETNQIALEKNITFFYLDKGEYYNLKPIGDEAQKRGYEVKYTSDLREKAVIGIYCQHVCFPENSQFSLILLHDMAQGHNRWPNIWEIERWNKFDIAVVPGRDWAERWIKASCMDYVNPRCGTFEFGYPKSDFVNDSLVLDRVSELKKSMNLKYKYSVLYAPSWENDGKEDDFIKALAELKVNLIIKQCHWSQEYEPIIKNIENMRAMHEGKYDNLYYIEPEESIMTALHMCDLIVSDESSVMVEGLMCGKPSIAVTDWLIPDTAPSRYACTPFTYVYKCEKAQLREKVQEVMKLEESSLNIKKWCDSIFSNAGNCCDNIMTAIEYYTQQKSDDSFMKHKLVPESQLFSMWN